MDIRQIYESIAARADKDAAENPWRWRGIGIITVLLLDYLNRR
jgi:hypothetical protein